MKKIIHIVALTMLFGAGVAMISCDKQTPCEKAEDDCRECNEGDALTTCLNSVDACRILLPGLGRDNCCKSLNPCP